MSAPALVQLTRDCAEFENDVASLWSSSRLKECVRGAREAQAAVREKQAECDLILLPVCSGHGSCNERGTCDCEPPYYGATCGRTLQCAFWNGSGFDDQGCSVSAVSGVTLDNDLVAYSGAARLVCECDHLTLFEALWEISWWDEATFQAFSFPMLSLPFSRWGELYEGLLRLPVTVYAMMLAVLTLLLVLLLWAQYKDRQHEYIAYMPAWYRAVRQVEFKARQGSNVCTRAVAWVCLLLLWFLTNHPWVVVFLVRPSDEFRHAHLAMMLFNMILAGN